MSMFKHLEGQIAVLVEGGVYKQADVYARGGFVYAKSGAGFVRLYADGSTTKAKCRIDTLHFDGRLFKDKFGRLCDASVDGAAALDGQALLRIGSA